MQTSCNILIGQDIKMRVDNKEVTQKTLSTQTNGNTPTELVPGSGLQEYLRRKEGLKGRKSVKISG